MVKKSDAEWRKFEKQVAEIESALSGLPASIKSPEYLMDIDSGDLREVDAVMRVNAGSTTLLVGFECRKRNSPQDVTWIEQLVAKRASLNLDRLIAVSTNGFTPAATKKAKSKGIELRQLSQMKETALDEIRTRISFNGFNFAALLKELSLSLDTSNQPRGVAEKHLQSALEQQGFNAILMYRYTDLMPVKVTQFITDLYGNIERRQAGLRERTPRIRLELDFPIPHYYYLAGTAKYPIKKIKIALDLEKGIIPFPINSVDDYTREDEKIGRIFQTGEAVLDNSSTARLTVVVNEDGIRSHATISTPAAGQGNK